MQISGLGSSDGSSTSITNNTTTTNNPATTSNAATSSDFGITVALQDSGEILNETEKFTENSNGGYLFGELDTDIAYNHDLSNVQSQIDTYTSSLASLT